MLSVVRVFNGRQDCFKLEPCVPGAVGAKNGYLHLPAGMAAGFRPGWWGLVSGST
jgi:hypothetical protein